MRSRPPASVSGSRRSDVGWVDRNITGQAMFGSINQRFVPASLTSCVRNHGYFYPRLDDKILRLQGFVILTVPQGRQGLSGGRRQARPAQPRRSLHLRPDEAPGAVHRGRLAPIGDGTIAAIRRAERRGAFDRAADCRLAVAEDERPDGRFAGLLAKIKSAWWSRERTALLM